MRLALLGLIVTSFGVAAQQPSPQAALTPERSGPVPAEAFFTPAKLRSPVLSPSGRWLAMLSSAPEQRVGILVLDLEGKEEQRFIVASGLADVNWLQWKNDDWLLFTVVDPGNRERGSKARGLSTVKRDGSESRLLIQRELTLEDPFHRQRALAQTFSYLGPGPLGSDDIVVAEAKWDVNGDFSHILPMLQNIVTRGVRTLAPDTPRGQGVWLDGQARPRVVLDERDGQTTLQVSDNGQPPWRVVSRAPRYETSFWPAYVDEAGSLMVTTERDGKGELRRFDKATGKPEAEALFSMAGFTMDVDPIKLPGRDEVEGLHLLTDARTTVWFTAEMQRIQALVDAKLPGRVNLLECRPCDKP